MPMVLEPDVMEAPYQGRAGATRIESVHVPLADRTLRTVSVHRAVNVGTDPHLRDAALSGALHRLEGGVELAVTFVYHDPALRKLALVVPDSLRHEELRERAKLLEMLAGETTVPVPRYVSEATVVIGLIHLAEYLQRPAGGARIDPRELRELEQRQQEVLQREHGLHTHEQGLAQREHGIQQREQLLAQSEPGAAQREQSLQAHEQALAQREQTLQTREQRMRERAEDVTRREDELAGQTEMHEASQRDLAMREQELEQRLEALQQRERELADRAAELDRRDTAERTPVAPRPVSSLPPSGASSLLSAVSSALGSGATGVIAPMRVPVVEPALPEDLEPSDDDDDVVEELDELEPIRTNPGTDGDVIGPMSSSAEDRLPVDDGVEELVDDDDVEEEVDENDIASEDGAVDELAPDDMAAEDVAPDEDGPKTMIATARTIANTTDIAETGIARPPELRGEVQMVAHAGEGIDLFVALGDDSDAFAGETDLLIQLVVLEGYPIVFLTLVDPTSGRPTVRRAALDPRAAPDRRVLEALRRRFEARTVFFPAEARTTERTGRAAAPRELNTARVLDRVSRLRTEPAIDASTAIERALSAPPPISGGHPFSAEDEPGRIDTASSAAVALADIAEWVAPEKMDHALLVLSVPRDVIDASFARVLERAVEHGLALPPTLVDRAIGAGLASDVGALLGKQIEAFRRTTDLPDHGGLDPEALASNWEKLLAAATEAEVAIDSDLHDVAWRAIRAFRGEQTGSTPGGPIDAARLAAMGPPELVMLLEHPRHRRLAAVALCDRADPAFADAVCKAVRKMPRAEVARVVPRITKLGDEAGDALIDGLSARKTFARQGFALALGHLKLRRAVVPLLHLLSSEPSDVWKEISRVYGTFGNASFRTLSQKLHDSKAPKERFVMTLAHLSNHGCAKQVEALEKDSDARVASMALEARALRDSARRQEESVTGKRPLEGSDPVIAFSRRFTEELDGTAPEADLANPPGDEA